MRGRGPQFRLSCVPFFESDYRSWRFQLGCSWWTRSLLPSGKVDQVALVALADAPPQQTAGGMDSVIPGMAQIWRAVLREDEIGASDDFFELGGNSLLAMQVIVRVRRRFGIDIPIRALFDNPTLAGFSCAVERGLRPPTANRWARSGRRRDQKQYRAICRRALPNFRRRNWMR